MANNPWRPYQKEIATLRTKEAQTPKRKKVTSRRNYPERDAVHLPLMRLLRGISRLDGFVMHIANERKTRSVGEGALLKSLGVLPGVSDLFIALPNNRYSGFWIELKAPGGKLSDTQREFLARMAKVGYCTGCYDNPMVAYHAVLDYLGVSQDGF